MSINNTSETVNNFLVNLANLWRKKDSLDFYELLNENTTMVDRLGFIHEGPADCFPEVKKIFVSLSDYTLVCCDVIRTEHLNSDTVLLLVHFQYTSAKYQDSMEFTHTIILNDDQIVFYKIDYKHGFEKEISADCDLLL